jgi:hypothetical protein
MTVMFLKEDQHGLIEHMHIAIVTLLGGSTLIMDDGIWKIPILPLAL